MRCRACNAMISVRRSKHGGFEDMCAQCIGWATSTIIDSDFTRKDDSLRQSSLSEALVISELGISVDIPDEYDNISMSIDRNHEVTDIFDKYEDYT